jgi:hypothetical protein
MEPQRRYSWIACTAAIAVVCVASPAMAQHVASAYVDGAGNESTLWTIVDTADGSSDCQHSGHSTGAWFDGPSGSSSGWQSGFSHSVSLSFAEGDFTGGGSLSFTCGCWGDYTSPDTTAAMKTTVTWYGNPTGGGGGCIYEDLACTSGTPTCDERPLLVSGAPQPCADHRRSTYLKVGDGPCRGLFSTGWFGETNRECS